MKIRIEPEQHDARAVIKAKLDVTLQGAGFGQRIRRSGVGHNNPAVGPADNLKATGRPMTPASKTYRCEDKDAVVADWEAEGGLAAVARALAHIDIAGCNRLIISTSGSARTEILAKLKEALDGLPEEHEAASADVQEEHPNQGDIIVEWRRPEGLKIAAQSLVGLMTIESEEG